MAKDDIIRASEIGSYIFCARAWWLQRVKGYEPDNLSDMERGSAFHLAHGRGLARSYRWQRWAYILIGAGVVAAVLAILRLT